MSNISTQRREEVMYINTTRLGIVANTISKVLDRAVEKSDLLDNPASNSNENISSLYKNYIEQYIVQKIRSKFGV